jgi:hypothetical protein
MSPVGPGEIVVGYFALLYRLSLPQEKDRLPETRSVYQTTGRSVITH